MIGCSSLPHEHQGLTIATLCRIDYTDDDPVYDDSSSDIVKTETVMDLQRIVYIHVYTQNAMSTVDRV